MTEQIGLITETEWGLHAVLKNGVVIDDTNIIQTMEYIITSCKETGKTKILIDASTIIRKASVLKMLEVAELPHKLGCQGIKIAFFAPGLADAENSKFMENAGYNRGLLVRYFHDKATAMEWLLK
jgi:hypothetical protein